MRRKPGLNQSIPAFGQRCARSVDASLNRRHASRSDARPGTGADRIT
jgi:hypothetical protein